MNIRSLNMVLCTLSLFCLSNNSAFANGYVFTDLGTLGWIYSGASAVNNNGQIVGYSANSLAENKAPLWSNGGVVAIGSLASATGINDAGQVAGRSGNSVPHALKWAGGVEVDLTPSGGYIGSAQAINSAGHVAGYLSTTTSNTYPYSSTYWHATIWDGSTARDLGTLGGNTSYGFSINDADQVVGASHTADNSWHATLWANGSIIDLGALDGGASTAQAINNVGQIAGWSTASGAYHAALWEGDSIFDLGTLDGGYYSQAFGINDFGKAVGMSTNSEGRWHATLWDNFHAVDLNSFLDQSAVSAGWVLTQANDINEKGWIVGNAYNTITGFQHGFLLAPVPEPEIYSMLFAGLGLMGGVVRRRKQQ